MKTIESERDEIRLRGKIKQIVEQNSVHPELMGISSEKYPDIFFLNKTCVAIITNEVYKLMVLEFNAK